LILYKFYAIFTILWAGEHHFTMWKQYHVSVSRSSRCMAWYVWEALWTKGIT